jgi:hypothetical protein
VETELKAPNTTLDGFKEATQEMKTFEWNINIVAVTVSVGLEVTNWNELSENRKLREAYRILGFFQ